MTTYITSWIWEHSPYRGAHKLLLLVMADSAGGSGRDARYYTRMNRLTEQTNETKEDVCRLLADLEADGAIVGAGARCNESYGWYWTHYDIIGPMPDEPLPRRRTGYIKGVIPKSIRAQVFARDGYRCVRCGATHDLAVDHIHPERHGGTLDLDNLQTLCRSCNSRKGARLP